jgi:hypothetical protein
MGWLILWGTWDFSYSERGNNLGRSKQEVLFANVTKLNFL